MLEAMVTFLVALIILALVVWAIHTFIGSLGLPAPVNTLVLVLVAVVALYVLYRLAVPLIRTL